ncbi:unnamed protein product, partial [Ilex paraguariensis]
RCCSFDSAKALFSQKASAKVLWIALQHCVCSKLVLRCCALALRCYIYSMLELLLYRVALLRYVTGLDS